MSNLKKKLPKIISIVALGALFAAWAGTYIAKSSILMPDGKRYFCMFDDAMISMRYAWNLVHGNGFVWNPGEYVEGITNFLWAIYMALFAAIFDKSTAVLGVQISGLLLMLAVAYFAMRVGEHLLEKSSLKKSSFLSVVIFGAALTYFPLNFWTLMGMETGFLAVILTASLWLVLRLGSQTRFSPALAILLGAAFLTRPDSALPASLIMLYRLSSVINKKGWLKAFALECAVIAAFVVFISAFRFFYYGSIVPNTYMLKVEGYPLGLRIENGLLFLDEFWITVVPTIAVCAFGLILDFRRDRALVFALFLCAVAYVIYVGGDSWGHWRLTAPYVPGLYALAIVEIAELIDRRAKDGALARLAQKRWFPPLHVLEAVLVVCIIVPILWYANRGYEKQVTLEDNPLYVRPSERNLKIALALRKLTTPEASAGVTWAGLIPYYSGRIGVDLLGKSDKYIASLEPDLEGVHVGNLKFLPGHCKYNLDYSIKKLKPTYVFTSGWGQQNVKSYINKHYTVVQYRGATLTLLKDSPYVKWDKLK